MQLPFQVDSSSSGIDRPVDRSTAWTGRVNSNSPEMSIKRQIQRARHLNIDNLNALWSLVNPFSLDSILACHLWKFKYCHANSSCLNSLVRSRAFVQICRLLEAHNNGQSVAVDNGFIEWWRQQQRRRRHRQLQIISQNAILKLKFAQIDSITAIIIGKKSTTF